MNTIALFAELIGTFALVMSIFVSGGSAIVIGLTFAAIIFLIGGISGAHVNPAISAAMYYSGSLSAKELMSYIIVQLIGGIGAGLLYTSL
jgi:aquaporin Z